MASYHESTTSSVAFNPYLPAIGRVLEVLRSYGAGETIEINNRDLAIAAGCSPGLIPRLYRQLEADGMIERVTSPRGSLVTVLRSPMGDRDSASQCDDQTLDRDSTVDRRTPNKTPDRSAAAAKPDQFIDPPHTPLIGTKHDSNQQQQLQGREALRDAIAAAGGAGVVAEILDKNPDLTLAEFEALRAEAKKRGSKISPDSIGLVFWCLQNNQPLHSAKEPAHVQRPAPARDGRRPASNQPKRSEQYARRDAAPPLTREYLQRRGRRGDQVPRLPGSGPAAGG